jgi:hypothetical protein
VAVANQTFAQMTPQKTCTAGDENTHG